MARLSLWAVARSREVSQHRISFRQENMQKLQLLVGRGPDAFEYDNLSSGSLSGCSDVAIADTLLLDVHFESPCSNVSLTKPHNDWVVSSLNNDRLKVRVANYNRDLLDFVKIQIAQAGTSNWQTVSFLDKTDLDPTTTETTLLLDQYPGWSL